MLIGYEVLHVTLCHRGFRAVRWREVGGPQAFQQTVNYHLIVK